MAERGEALWYDESGIAMRKMALFCPNRELLEKLLTATLRSFGYEDPSEEVPTITRELLEALLAGGESRFWVMNILSRVAGRQDLENVYSVACSFFSGLDEIPEALAKLRLLESCWEEVKKKGGGSGSAGHVGGSGAVATGSVQVVRTSQPEEERQQGMESVLIEALSEAHLKGMRRAVRVLSGMIQLARGGRLSPSHLSNSTLTRILKGKGLEAVVPRLGLTDRLILVAATSIRDNATEVHRYLESCGLASAIAAGSPLTTPFSIPAIHSPALRTLPLH